MRGIWLLIFSFSCFVASAVVIPPTTATQNASLSTLIATQTQKALQVFKNVNFAAFTGDNKMSFFDNSGKTQTKFHIASNEEDE